MSQDCFYILLLTLVPHTIETASVTVNETNALDKFLDTYL